MTETVKFEKSPAEQQLYLAHVWRKRGKIDAAIASYQKVIDLQPNYTEAHLQFGEFLLETGRETDAIAVYQRAMELNPDEATFYQQVLDNFLKPAPIINESSAPPIDNIKGHILLYTDCPEIYGAAQLNHALMCGLVGAAYKVTSVQAEASHYLISQRNQLGIQHIWLEPDNIYNPLKPANAFTNTDEPKKIFTQAQPDLIIFGDGCPFSSLTAKEVAIEMGIPYIQLVHCVTSEWAKKFEDNLPRLPKIYQNAFSVITVSQENLNLLHQDFKLPENIGVVIYNGKAASYFNPQNIQIRDRIRQELNIPLDGVVCLTTARLDPVKGYQYQLSAIQQLQNSDIWSKLYFIWAGGGNLTLLLKNLSSEMGISKQIKFVGERSDIPNLLDAADIFILPSQYEGMPLAIMEAMAKGKPVIASTVSGIPEELGDTGKLLPDPKIDSGATIQELANTIQEWAANPELRNTVGKACKNRAEKLFKEERMLEDYIEIIEQTLSNLSK
ncbi:MAG TPA: glycosyltransferase family 1 protein [Cyanobacteria bacterium UBA11149]|nr:glycosyltransferase family 1 protein [Cyanobacteria bacterium UBA11367]HBE58216.1 glycosyltransferase family 1 protein [Cyanobacteria bacterium UBA11366]HBK66925.1 glycosyltransferase family 1 protein [Cyanobacteria bacterium UBA11166]HBR76166.1 glycosyltransferase family 1 protein [Cyanobacteria bacterium UBA11159]HBS70741.1 glycosyltransferase family 1 protein [Cyanobacteria bacterium UBA11153]HBW88567.1 glycosyltransferase family 1 protein [Cyanobacteria bacterium UBA11149]HCA95872.1 gl